MDIKLLIELIIVLLIGFRIYTLEKFQIKSAADKLFALYYIKNHYPLIGYTIIFYIFEIIFLQMIALKIVDITLIVIAMLELYMIYRHLFIALKTDDKDDYIDTVIKRMFTALTYSEYQEIKLELYKIQPKWKLYITEMLVFFFAIWSIEFQ
jgi:hypothetical protein